MYPLQKREQLRAELATAHGNFGRAQKQMMDLDIEMARKERELNDAYATKARGGEDRTEQVEKERLKLWREHRSAAADMEGAGLARVRIEEEIQLLQAANMDAFMEEAERLSIKATEALEALRQPYWRALEAWATAQREWQAIQPQLFDLIKQVDAVEGKDRDRTVVTRASLPSGFPFSEPVDIFDRQLSPRPKALVPQSEEAELTEDVDVVVTDAR